MNDINIIEKRVSTLEKNQAKLAQLQQQFNNGQCTIVEVLNDLVNGRSEEITEAVGLQFGAAKKEIEQVIDTKTTELKSEMEVIKKVIDSDGLTQDQADELNRERKRRNVHLLGGKLSVKYKLFNEEYFKRQGESIKNKFDSDTFKRLPRQKFDEIIAFVRYWKPSELEEEIIKDSVILKMGKLQDETEGLKEQLNDEKISRSESFCLADKINKNEKTLKKYNDYMNRSSRKDK